MILWKRRNVQDKEKENLAVFFFQRYDEIMGSFELVLVKNVTIKCVLGCIFFSSCCPTSPANIADCKTIDAFNVLREFFVIPP